jgi:hypothetical protein
MQDICRQFPVTTGEFEQLEKKFGNLCQYAAWQLIKKNSRNNHTDEQEDITQELRVSLLRAGSYYKRQVYIEKCLRLCAAHARDKLLVKVVASLQDLWDNKTRHGASRQKFGPYQEHLLDQIVKKVVPKSQRPSKREPLMMDTKFATYCKAITWNAQKSIGKKITKEKPLRCAQVSLSEYSYLGGY